MSYKLIVEAMIKQLKSLHLPSVTPYMINSKGKMVKVKISKQGKVLTLNNKPI
jgi:hypothetical protein